jgi:hypothetical protein
MRRPSPIVWLIPALLPALAACSSSSSPATPEADAASDTQADVLTDADAAEAPWTPGTTGDPCSIRDDCDPEGTFGSTCYSMSKTVKVCITGDCDVNKSFTPCDQGKGYCYVSGGGGVCVGACSFGLDGTWKQKCAAGVTCVPGTESTAADKSWTGEIGFCITGICTSDADCVAPSPKCQVESGSCVPKDSYVTLTGKPGDDCKVSSYGPSVASSNCYCFGDAKKAGYCSNLCTVGGPACANGYTCTALLPKKTPTGGAAFTKQPDGVSGFCAKSCTVDADCATLLDGGWCDTNYAGPGFCRRGVKP